ILITFNFCIASLLFENRQRILDFGLQFRRHEQHQVKTGKMPVLQIMNLHLWDALNEFCYQKRHINLGKDTLAVDSLADYRYNQTFVV
ncbi:MAG: hypothetical protein LDL41_21570, partial [Coleofasciculus sp. S288]|nr:hypothetical protein [Coleofasciculus sp. S288]